MRVELIYRPDNDTYKSIHKILQDIIAEEGLPIPVEMVEDKVHTKSPSIRIDGRLISKKGVKHTFEYLHDLLCKKWAELTHMRHHLL